MLRSRIFPARFDPTNAENYTGLDTAMSLSGLPAKERAAALGRYPAGADGMYSDMPSTLVYQLALARAEAGEYDQALALFKDRFFPSEEGGVSASQVLSEIKLMQAKANADGGRCTEARAFLGEDHSGLVLNEAVSRPYAMMATIAKKCGDQGRAEDDLKKAAASHAHADAVWANRAQQLLGSQDPDEGRQKLQELLAADERVKDANEANGWWWYNLGVVQSALDQKDEARESFRKVLLLPDRMMSHHLARVAMMDPGAGK